MKFGEGIRTDPDGYLNARGLGDARRATDKLVRTYTPDRRCRCGTRLSIYNPDEHCARCDTDKWADH